MISERLTLLLAITTLPLIYLPTALAFCHGENECDKIIKFDTLFVVAYIAITCCDVNLTASLSVCCTDEQRSVISSLWTGDLLGTEFIEDFQHNTAAVLYRGKVFISGLKI